MKKGMCNQPKTSPLTNLPTSKHPFPPLLQNHQTLIYRSPLHFASQIPIRAAPPSVADLLPTILPCYALANEPRKSYLYVKAGEAQNLVFQPMMHHAPKPGSKPKFPLTLPTLIGKGIFTKKKKEDPLWEEKRTGGKTGIWILRLATKRMGNWILAQREVGIILL